VSAFRAVVLDLDGTVLDSHSFTFAAVRHAAAPWGAAPSDAEIHAAFGPAERVFLARFVPAGAVAAAYARLQEHYRAHAAEVRVHARIPPLLADARAAGLGCGLFTGRGRDSTALLLGAHELAGAFDAIVTGDDPVPPKPAPDGIGALATAMHCRTSEILVVGDSPLDVAAAVAAGAASAFATWYALEFVAAPPGAMRVATPDELRPALGLPL